MLAAPSQAQARSVWRQVSASGWRSSSSRQRPVSMRLSTLVYRSRRKLGQRPGAADDAVEGQDQRHGRGLLEVRTPRDLGGKIVAPLRPPGEPALDEGLDVAGVAQWLELADSVGFVCVIDGELIVSTSSAGW